MDSPLSEQIVAALSMQGITKRFGSLLANDNISLNLANGEVLALLGENGAGKSTLVSILFGHYVADAGEFRVFGKSLPPGKPKAALAAGIGMVHQHFALADNLSVRDNLTVGTQSLWSITTKVVATNAMIAMAIEQFGLKIDLQARVGDLSVGEKQRVEILRALVRGARILILDEPTSVLTPQEADALFATLRALTMQGMAVIFISHKLDEVMRISQRVAVLRHGRLVALNTTAETSAAQIARQMMGVEARIANPRIELPLPQGEGWGEGAGAPEPSPLPSPRGRGSSSHPQPRCEPHDVYAQFNDRERLRSASSPLQAGRDLEIADTSAAQIARQTMGAESSIADPRIELPLPRGEGWGEGAGIPEPSPLPSPRGRGSSSHPQPLCELHDVYAQFNDREQLRGLSLTLHAGRVLAIAGISGNGQLALAQLLHGQIEASAGRVIWDAARTVARVPEDRIHQGVVGDLPLWENAVSEHLRPHFSRWGWVKRRAARAHAQSLVDAFDVRGAGLDSPARALSGGNMQKLVLGRAMLPLANRAPPGIVVVHQPTWGLDVGAVASVQQRLRDARAAGAAVLLISDDLDEVFALADEIGVMHAGRLTQPKPQSNWSRESIGLAMAGEPTHAA